MLGGALVRAAEWLRARPRLAVAAVLLFPVVFLLRDAIVAPGAHVVEMVYRPPGLLAGLAVSVFSMLAALTLAWRTSRPGPQAGLA